MLRACSLGCKKLLNFICLTMKCQNHHQATVEVFNTFLFAHLIEGTRTATAWAFSFVVVRARGLTLVTKLLSSDPEDVINIADYMTSTCFFIKLGYLQNFM